MATGYRLRSYKPSDAGALCWIENAADELFADFGFPEIAAEKRCTVSEFAAIFSRSELTVAVAVGTDLPIGFAATEVFGDHLYLRQMSVDPKHGRKGIGARLLGEAITQARRNGFPALWLSTFRDVPFNMPFYAKHGFREVPLEDADLILNEMFDSELPDNTSPTTRALMRLTLR